MTSPHCYIIAEAGVNHNGSVDLAHQLIEVAAHAGADAVKFQTFNAESLVSASAPKAEYQKTSTNDSASQLELLRSLELSQENFKTLSNYCLSKGIEFLSTPFDETSADFLDSLGMRLFKTPSGELTNLPLLRHIALKEKPMIVSTGMADLGETELAVRTIRSAGCPELWLLHCVSAYPAPPETINLRAMQTLHHAFGVPTGFSDHTEGIHIPIAAAALGAVCIEKHFTLDKTMAGPDHKASLDPAELKAMVCGIRDISVALGTGIKSANEVEKNTAEVARRSLVAAHNLSVGHVLTWEDIKLQRPGTGLPPSALESMIGRTLSSNVKKGDIFTWNHLS